MGLRRFRHPGGSRDLRTRSHGTSHQDPGVRRGDEEGKAIADSIRVGDTVGVIRSLSAFALVLLTGCSAEPDKAAAPAVPRFDAVGANAVARGERLARVLGCTGCHGKDLTGHAWEDDPKVAILFTSNLTRAVPRYTDEQLALTIRGGARPDGSPLWEMPSSIFSRLVEPDMADLIAFLRSVPPTGVDHPRLVIGPGGRKMIASGEIKPEPQFVREERYKGPVDIGRGHDTARYMIRATCAECHGIELKGDQDPKDGSGPPDLSIVSAYSLEQFRHLLRTGEPVGGRKLKLMAEVSRGRFVHLTDREVEGIYFYLKARAGRVE